MKDGKIKNIRKKFGARIRELRTAAGLTQEELGDKASLSYKYIGELERGRVNVSLDSIAKIAFALGIRPESFFSQKPPRRKKVVVVKEKSLLSKLSPRDLRLIKKALQLLNKTIRNL